VKRATRPSARPAPPVLVRQIRGRIVESEHRGHVVEADVNGRLVHVLGDPDRLVALRSCVKPFGLVSLIEAGGIAAFDLGPAELALMASSHSGEDLHVRTLQGVFRRAGVSQTVLACGAEGMPLDALTAARLARDGERPSPVRHMCSGQHAVAILLSRMRGWPLESYWREDHPAQVEYRTAVARSLGTTAERLPAATDDCGLPTYALPLREVARAYAFLADPGALPKSDSRATVAPALTIVRDAMLEHPDMVAGTRERLDTSLMKGLPKAVVSKGGQEGLRAVAVLPGAAGKAGRNGSALRRATGLVVKIEDGSGHERAGWAAAVEALAQAGVLDGQPLRMLARYHRPTFVDPHGRTVAEAVADFELAPVGELIG
jgi:L-asparaginase II